MYLADLTPFGSFGLLAVGWLEKGHDYPRGKWDGKSLRRLAQYCSRCWQPRFAMGWHDCEFCEKANGKANLLVPGNGKVYIAPELIVHYILHHQYLPPAEFKDALMSCPCPSSLAYFKVLRANGLDPVEYSLPGGDGSLHGIPPEQWAELLNQRRAEFQARYFPDEAGPRL